MSVFDRFSTADCVLRKKSGVDLKIFKTMIQSTGILIFDLGLPIEEGDIISRVAPNGIEDRYLVLDSTYTKGIAATGDYYSVKYRKENSIAQTSAAHVNYNFHGANSRVNISSTDNSHNVVGTLPDPVFVDLRNAILEKVTDEGDSQKLLEAVDKLEESHGKSSFLQSYQEFVQNAANYVTIIGPFLPALTQMLGR